MTIIGRFWVTAEGSEPVVLIGDSGTGKTHLATGLCLAACRQKRRVRFTTAAGLVNELIEAKQQNQVRRVMAKWQKYELIVVDELGYVPLADIGAEFLFSGGERPGRAGGANCDDEPAVFRVDECVSEPAIVQGAAGAGDGSGAYFGHREGVVSVYENEGGTAEGTVKSPALWGTPASLQPGLPKATSQRMRETDNLGGQIG